tara:strand:+ start:96 stop:293 length:198 start_codon:yes stop_codon:yes gene_type:complete
VPTYQYRCEVCEDEFEHFQSMSSDKLEQCKKCGQKTLRRLLGAGSAIIFKGSGFYQTDYKNKTNK